MYKPCVRYTDVPAIPVLNPISACWYDFFSNIDVPKFPIYRNYAIGVYYKYGAFVLSVYLFNISTKKMCEISPKWRVWLKLGSKETMTKKNDTFITHKTTDTVVISFVV